MEGPSGSLAPSRGNAGKCLVLSVSLLHHVFVSAPRVGGDVGELEISAALENSVQEEGFENSTSK